MILLRYQIRQFLATFVFTILALCALFVVVDVIERLDKFIDHHVALADIARYYVAYLPFIIKLVIPVATLLAALFSVGRLSTSNEITAMRAAGSSPARLLLPYIFVACSISLFQVYFNGWVVPASKAEHLLLDRTLLFEGTGGSLFNLYFRDVPTRTVFIEYYEQQTATARNVRVEEFGSVDHPRITWRVDASVMTWDAKRRQWVAPKATLRDWRGGTTTSMRIVNLDSVVIPFAIAHEDIERLQRGWDELSLDEMDEYMATMRAGGRDVRSYEIDYHATWAFPFANIVIVLIAVPFASVRRRGGIAIHIAVAMILAFAYIVFTEITKAIGLSTTVHPAVIGWSANAVFLVVALAAMKRR